MKAEDIYNKALAEYPIKEKLNEKAVGTYDANYPRRKAFVAGAEWMQERMIEKAVEWMKEEMCYRDQSSGRGHWGEIETLGVYDSLEEFIDDFKKAMEEEKNERRNTRKTNK